jgi:hypothetical protein
MGEFIAIIFIALLIHIFALFTAIEIRSWLITFLVAKIRNEVDRETYRGILSHYQNFLGRFVSFTHHGILKSNRDRKILSLCNGIVNYFKLSLAVLVLTLAVLGVFY